MIVWFCWHIASILLAVWYPTECVPTTCGSWNQPLSGDTHVASVEAVSLSRENLTVRLVIRWVVDVLMPPVLRSQIGFWPDWRERHGAPGCHRKV
jgi:hypothetical protein